MLTKERIEFLIKTHGEEALRWEVDEVLRLALLGLERDASDDERGVIAFNTVTREWWTINRKELKWPAAAAALGVAELFRELRLYAARLERDERAERIGRAVLEWTCETCGFGVDHGNPTHAFGCPDCGADIRRIVLAAMEEP